MARRPEAARDRAGRGGRRRLGAARGRGPRAARRTCATSARSATRSWPRLDGDRARPVDLRHQRPGPDRARPPRTGAGRSARRSKRSSAARPTSSSACRRGSAPAGVDAVAREVAAAAPRRDRLMGRGRARPSGPSPPTRTSSDSPPSSTRRRPDDPTSLEEMRWSDATYPGATRFLAELDGRAVGAATVGRIYMYPPDYPALVGLHRSSCPRPAGGASASDSCAAISDAARSAGKTGAPHPLRRGPPRGHRVPRPSRLHRARALEDGPPRPRRPRGAGGRAAARHRALTTLGRRGPTSSPASMPWRSRRSTTSRAATTPMAAGDLAEFRARDVDRPGDPEGRLLRGRRPGERRASSATPA